MNPAANDTQQVLGLVQRWADAELAGDVEAYGQLPTADFTGVGPVGFVLTGEQWAKRHLGDLHNEKFEVLYRTREPTATRPARQSSRPFSGKQPRRWDATPAARSG